MLATCRVILGVNLLDGKRMYQMNLFCRLATISLLAAGLFSLSLLRGTQPPPVYTTAPVWVPAGILGACSGRSK